MLERYGVGKFAASSAVFGCRGRRAQGHKKTNVRLLRLWPFCLLRFRVWDAGSHGSLSEARPVRASEPMLSKGAISEIVGAPCTLIAAPM